MEFNGHELKTKAYVIQCFHEHYKTRYTIQYTWANTAFEDFIKSIKSLGVEVVQTMTREDIQHEVETKDFYGYSTLLFIFYLNCTCDSVYWVNCIHESLQANEKLRCITKIVLDYSFGFGCARSVEAVWRDGEISVQWQNDILLNGEYSSKTNELNAIKRHSIVSSTPYKLPKIDNLVFLCCKVTGNYYDKAELDPLGYEEYIDDDDDEDGDYFDDEFDEIVEEQENNVTNEEELEDDQSKDEEEILLTHDSEYEITWKSKNFPKGEKLFFHIMIDCLFELAKVKSIQDICRQVDRTVQDRKVKELVFFEHTSSGGCYFFNINPALFIAINHLTFRDFKKREGSDKDIEAIKRMCTLHRIPHLIIEDGSAEQVQELLHLLQSTNLSLLNHLFISVMSHGTEGDIIYTKTSTYTVDDVKKAVLKNASLRNVETLLFVNTCRGRFDPRYDSKKQPLVPTYNSDLDDTTVVLYSTRKGCVSLRSKAHGSVAVQKFTKEFEKCLLNFSLKEVHTKMENDLLQQNFDFDAMTELCASPSAADHVIRMEFKNLTDFMDLYRKFEIAAAEFQQQNKNKRRRLMS